MTWIADVARAWDGGRYDACEAGHGAHQTVRVDSCHLGDGEAWRSELTVFDWSLYVDTDGFCEGDDDVSKSIEVSGAYERPESAMVREVLMVKPGVQCVIDLGCHVGWYTMIAAAAGYPTIAVDASKEHLRVLDQNVSIEGYQDRVWPVRGWIGPDTPPIPMDSYKPVRLLKADLESLEDEAVRVCAPLFERLAVDYFLMEVSPVMADHYPDTVREVLGYGYGAYVVPGAVPQNPLELWADRLDLHPDPAATVASWDQRNVLFVKKELIYG